MRHLFQACILLMLSSCITFNYSVPQPKGIKKLKTYPAELQGSYSVNPKIDSILVTADCFRIIASRSKSLAVKDVDSFKTVRVSAGKVYDNDFDSMKGIEYTIRNDNIYYSYKKYDTYFLSDSVIVKKYKSCYFLSYKFDKNSNWQLVLLEKQGIKSYIIYSLSVFDYDKEMDIADSSSLLKAAEKGKTNTVVTQISSITKCTRIEDDADQYLINPSRRQLMKIIRILKKKGILKPLETMVKY